jgi:WD40 repeat protein
MRRRHHLRYVILAVVCAVAVVSAICYRIISHGLSDPRWYENQGFFSVAWNPNGKEIAVGGAQGVFLFNEGLHQTAHFEPRNSGIQDKIYSLAWHPSGTLLAGDTGNGYIVFVNPDQSQIDYLPIGSGFAEWSPDGSQLATMVSTRASNNDVSLQVWAIHVTPPPLSATPRVAFPAQHEWIDLALWSPDSRLIASTSNGEGTIRVWDSETGQQLLRLPHPANKRVGSQISISWSPDSRLLASTNSDGEIRVWKIASGNTILSFEEGSQFGASSIMWSPDGTYLATANGENVKIWDATNGQLLMTLNAIHRSVDQAIWSPDGRRIAAIGTIQEKSRATIWVWDVSTGQLLASGH